MKMPAGRHAVSLIRQGGTLGYQLRTVDDDGMPLGRLHLEDWHQVWDVAGKCLLALVDDDETDPVVRQLARDAVRALGRPVPR